MPCAYFVLFKIVSIPSDCMFKIDAEGNFQSLSEGCLSVSIHDGKRVMGISQGEKDIAIAPEWGSESGKNYVVRLTKNIILRPRISYEFLVWF